MSAFARSFPPIEGERVRLLILGSMPGVASLEAARYYAHPRNAFWPIVLDLLDPSAAGPPDAPPSLPPYERRVERLAERGVALWDVLAECERPGSLDSAIRPGSERCNDIPGLCGRHPELRLIAFNGRTAEKLYRRHVADAVRRTHPGLALATLPSTSPAHASLDVATKRSRWHAALQPFLPPASRARGESGPR